MDTFHYTVKSKEGKTIKGEVEARSERHAVSVLKEREYFVIDLKKHGQKSQYSTLFQGKVGQKDVMQFTQQLSTMLNAGMTLADALALLQMQSKPAMAKVLTNLAHDIQGGTSFSAALNNYPQIFSTVYRSLVRAGEASGKLDTILVRLTENEEKASEFRSKTKGALVYPMIVFTAMIGVMGVIVVFVIPQMTELYTSFGAELPFMTQVMVSISNFVKSSWWLILMLLIGGFFGYKSYYATPIGRMKVDTYKLKIPIFGKLKIKTAAAELARTLSLLVAGGVSILEAIKIAEDSTDNAFIKQAIGLSAKEVEKGMPMAASFAKHQVFPLVMAQMMAVGEETGELAAVLEKVAHYLSAEVEALIKNLTTAIEPLMMVMLGVMVMIVAFTVFTPLYKITTLF